MREQPEAQSAEIRSVFTGLKDLGKCRAEMRNIEWPLDSDYQKLATQPRRSEQVRKEAFENEDSETTETGHASSTTNEEDEVEEQSGASLWKIKISRSRLH